MDNFMDKLANKFNAQDMIKSNLAAEEKELKRVKMQIEEYDQRLQEMRKINLKTVEILDKAQQLLDENQEKTNESEVESKQSEVVTKQLEAVTKQLDDSIHSECVKVYRNVQAVVVDETKNQTELIFAYHKTEAKKMKGMKPLIIVGIILTFANILLTIVNMLGVI